MLKFLGNVAGYSIATGAAIVISFWTVYESLTLIVR